MPHTDEMRPSKAEDARLRRLAKKHGCRLDRSRRGESIDNFGGYMIVDVSNGPRGACVAGSRFELTAADVREWLTS